MRHVLGVDFDNTIVSYDDVLYHEAVRQGLIPSTFQKNKKPIRDHVRQLPQGEIVWQRLQAIIYAVRMNDAKLAEGVQNFFELGEKNGYPIYIVSHKTEFSRYDVSQTNLRAASLQWMRENHFFDRNGFGLSESHVFFESDRLRKIERIQNLECSHFIDDLEEVFLEPAFPNGVEKILYSPDQQYESCSDAKVFPSWNEICSYLYHVRN